MSENRESQNALLKDPFFLAAPVYSPADLPDLLRNMGPRPEGDPAFDPGLISKAAARLNLGPVDSLGPELEHVVRVGLAHIDATFDGDHPRYGTGTYAESMHDGFPPTIVAAVDALTLWGMVERAESLLEYWLQHFVRQDGTIEYYGTSLSEYGQLLTSACRVVDRGGDSGWLKRNREKLERIVNYVESRVVPVDQVVMPIGVPEADENDRAATYFHNAAWLARGLQDYSRLANENPSKIGEELAALVVEEVRDCWSPDESEWWLSPIREDFLEGYWAPPHLRVVGNRFGSYTNYRYWPELLSSRILPADLANRVVNARLAGGGQFLGVTRFESHLDDWPLMDYLEGLHRLGRMRDFHLSLWGHILYHQAKDHLTAYEQVSLPTGKKMADYCLPCQLVAVRAAAYLV